MTRQSATDRTSRDVAIVPLVVAAVCALALALVVAPARAVVLDSVYAAEVDMPDRGGLNAAFDEALGQVLIKVTGVPALGTAAARRSLVSDSAALVRKYSTEADNRVRVEFNGPALQAALDQAGQPVWGADRPLLALWYAVDEGNGRRVVLPAAAESGEAMLTKLRTRLLESADARGLPVVLPLVDAEDLGQVSFADLWGNFREPLERASRRYGADGILLGRSRSLAPDARRVRWTLTTRTDQFAWEGSVADGPAQAASYLAQSLATYANAADTLRLMVTGVDNLSRYGQVRKHLLALNVVAGAAVARVEEDRVEFDLVVRGDAARLQQALDAGRLLSRAEAQSVPAAPGPGTRLPDLVYRWAAR